MKLLEKASKLSLNTKLMLDKNLTNKEIKKIIKLHKKLKTIFKYEKQHLKEFKKAKKRKDIMAQKIIQEHLILLSQKVEKIEYKLQKYWHFKQDKKYHRYWYLQPACNCPKLDNKERFGTDKRIYNKKCLIHGKGK